MVLRQNRLELLKLLPRQTQFEIRKIWRMIAFILVQGSTMKFIETPK